MLDIFYMMYSEYIDFLNAVNEMDITAASFKNSNVYNSVLEHVSVDHGNKYLKHIENDFTITYIDIQNFVNINDKYGDPNKHVFTTKSGEKLYCSPTTLRYIYHALVILKYYSDSGSKTIAEVGCGYGGLFLAINYFKQFFNTNIEHYYLIDLPEVNNLILNYINAISDSIYTPEISYSIIDATTYGQDIPSNDLFFISNYCFTEILPEYRESYTNTLISKCLHGFITWQSSAVNLSKCYSIGKKILKIEEERPQTSHGLKNYFVYF